MIEWYYNLMITKNKTGVFREGEWSASGTPKVRTLLKKQALSESLQESALVQLEQ